MFNSISQCVVEFKDVSAKEKLDGVENAYAAIAICNRDKIDYSKACQNVGFLTQDRYNMDFVVVKLEDSLCCQRFCNYHDNYSFLTRAKALLTVNEFFSIYYKDDAKSNFSLFDHHFKRIGTFPLREQTRKLKEISETVARIVARIATLSDVCPNQVCFPEFDSLFLKFTDLSSLFHSKVNLAINFSAMTDEMVKDVTTMSLVVRLQTPKYSGYCYKSTLLSSLDILMMCAWKKFHLPGFQLTTTNPFGASQEQALQGTTSESSPNAWEQFYNPYTKKKWDESIDFCHNVILKFDTRDYLDNSTRLTNKLTALPNQNLLGFDNLYKWEGMQLTNSKIPVICLKVLKPNETEGQGQELDFDWSNNYVSVIQKSKNVGSEVLLDSLKKLLGSYGRNMRETPGKFPPLDFGTMPESVRPQ